MKQDQEKKQVCKLCNKSFLNGKILEAHMKIHAKIEFKLENSNVGVFEGYGLRENPKKSWKFSGLSHSDSVLAQGSVKCNLCGKEFVTPRSLLWHMRHHSRRERKGIHCKECGKQFNSFRSLTGHMRLHSEKFRVSSRESGAHSRPSFAVLDLSDSKTINLVRRKRSNRTRYKATANSCFSSLNVSVSGLDIEHEVLEVAVCLLMLSRGVNEWGGFNSVGEYLDNKSMTFEEKSFHQNKRTRGSDRVDAAFGGNGLVKVKKRREEKLDACGSHSEGKMSDCSEFECERVCSVEKKTELKVSTEAFYKGVVDSERPKLDDESGFVLCDAEVEKGSHDEMNSSAIEAEPSQDLGEEVGLDASDLEIVKSIPSNEVGFDSACDAELGKDSCNRRLCSTSDFDAANDSWKKSEFKCKICNKILPTYQSLGGHQTVHRTTKSCSALKIENRQKDINTTTSPKIVATTKTVKLECIEDPVGEGRGGVSVTGHESDRSKEHKCTICLKTFVSGQALGGHKRTHFNKARYQTTSTKPEISDIREVIDVNLPVMFDAEVNHDVGFRSWWAGSGHECVPLVGLITN